MVDLVGRTRHAEGPAKGPTSSLEAPLWASLGNPRLTTDERLESAFYVSVY